MNRIELKRNRKPVPHYGYTLNFINGQYKNNYKTFLEQLDCDLCDKCISLTPSE